MEPITREETYLKQIADNTAAGGGGGGGGSDLPSDPSTDGVYSLVNTVSSGAGTLNWAAPADMTILCTGYTGMWTEATYTLLSGTYADLKAKLLAHTPVRCMVFLGITETEEFPGMWGQFGFGESMLWTFGQGETEFIQLACSAGDDDITVYVLPDNTVATESPWD